MKRSIVVTELTVLFFTLMGSGFVACCIYIAAFPLSALHSVVALQVETLAGMYVSRLLLQCRTSPRLKHSQPLPSLT